MEQRRIKSILESLIFASDGPLSIISISEILGTEVERENIKRCLDELVEEYSLKRGGFVLEEVAKGYQFRTVSENADYVKQLAPSRVTRLSRPAMEVLAIVAYRQPVIKAQIEKIRGVDCSGVIKKLLELGLIKIIGRKDEVGQPLIYGTTPFFLETFGLKNLSELPPLTEFHELAPNITLPDDEKGLGPDSEPQQMDPGDLAHNDPISSDTNSNEKIN